jgi:hypothetical protein
MCRSVLAACHGGTAVGLRFGVILGVTLTWSIQSRDIHARTWWRNLLKVVSSAYTRIRTKAILQSGPIGEIELCDPRVGVVTSIGCPEDSRPFPAQQARDCIHERSVDPQIVLVEGVRIIGMGVKHHELDGHERTVSPLRKMSERQCRVDARMPRHRSLAGTVRVVAA